jgi:hypothetical protein
MIRIADVTPVHKPAPVNSDDDRKTYRREWMRKRRAAAKADQQTLVI